MFTDAQRDIVYGDVHNRAVYAGPGSGKTAVLTQHLIHLLATGRIAPSSVGVMTFTRQSALELKARLMASPKIAKSQVASLRIGTFHSLIFRMLLQLNVPVYPLLTAEQQQRILAGIVHLEREHAVHPEVWAARMNKYNADWPRVQCDKQAERVFASYERHKRRLGRWDYDDVLTAFCRVVDYKAANWDDVPRLAYLLVDEFQDTNAIQIHILRTLHHRFAAPLFVVGDEDQSIYGFRGANPCWLLQFPTLFESVRKHTLSANFRSDASIITAAYNVIRNNVQRSDKSPQVIRGAEGSVSVYAWPDQRVEAKAIAQQLATQRAVRDTVAVLARTRIQLMEAAKMMGERYSGVVEYRTFHDAKGKEWDEVHVIGAVQQNPYTPHGNQTDTEEERRLFYVAMTRARHRLLLHAPRRIHSRKANLSQFLLEAGIPVQERGKKGIGPSNG